MSEWDDIEGFESWSRKLRSLLDAAADAAKQTNHDSRFAMSERLTEFVENSFPNDEKIRALDDIASKAAIGLLEQNVDERLKSIVTRNTELAQLSKQFDIGSMPETTAFAFDAGAGSQQLYISIGTGFRYQPLDGLDDVFARCATARGLVLSMAIDRPISVEFPALS